MRTICSVALVSVALVIANSSASLAQDRAQRKTTDEMLGRLIQAEKKGNIVQVTLKDGTVKWGRAADVSAAAFSLLSVAANGSDMKCSLRYDQIASVRYESGWTRFVRRIRDVVTAPIVIPVFTIWWLQGYRC